MRKTTFDKLITALEKQAASNVIVFYEKKDFHNSVYVCNEYCVLRFDTGIYAKCLENKKAYFAPLENLIELSRTQNGITYRISRGSVDIFNTKSLLSIFEKYGYFDTTSKLETIDTNIDVNNFYDHNIPVRYFVNENCAVAINSSINAALATAYNNCNVFPYVHSTTDIDAVLFTAPGLSAAVLPVRTGKTDLNGYLYEHFKPQISADKIA